MSCFKEFLNFSKTIWLWILARSRFLFFFLTVFVGPVIITVPHHRNFLSIRSSFCGSKPDEQQRAGPLHACVLCVSRLLNFSRFVKALLSKIDKTNLVYGNLLSRPIPTPSRDLMTHSLPCDTSSSTNFLLLAVLWPRRTSPTALAPG